MNIKKLTVIAIAAIAASSALSAQNPIIRDAFSADPSAHYFDGRVYVYPSHDIPAPPEYNRRDWFCMADYHVYSSDNLVDWVDHGVIVDQVTAPWVNDTGFSMWAPDCNYHNGKYYFYFPAGQKPQPGARFAGNGIGVAISETPYGRFVCEEKPIQGIGGIDPCIFIDDDGTPYLAWSGRGLQVVRLKDNMLELDSEPVTVTGIPRGMTEGPFLFKRNGKYYYTFPWVEAERETLAYCMADNPLGPYTFMGKFMEQSETICWTNHHSIIEFKGQTYLFYHHRDYSPEFDKNRSVCADSIFFEPDGRIRMMRPTLRGIGVTKATAKIELDRYSELSASGDSIAYLEPSNTFAGWKTVFYEKGSWAQYNTVQFDKAPKNVTLKIVPPSAGTLEILQDNKVIATVEIPADRQVITATAKVKGAAKGVHHVKVRMASGDQIQVDWLSFN